MRLLSLYERHYPRIVGGIAILIAVSAAYVIGYAKGSPKPAGVVLADWSVQAAGVLASAWEQTAGTRPEHFLQPSRKPGSGVTVNTLPDTGDLILLTGFFDDDPGLRLIRRDGSVVASWRAAFSDLMPERRSKPGAPQTDWNIDLHGSHVDPDGAVAFNFEYQGTVKLDRCGKRLWSLEEHNHHTLSPAAGGGYWIGGRRIEKQPDDPEFRPLTNALRETGRIEDDEILRVSADGKVLARKSVFDILMANGLEPLLTANGDTFGRDALKDNEILHLNKITELTPDRAAAFPEFRAGDLAISVRDFNLVMVVDPAGWKVKWYSVGPWIRQHSAQFMPDGTIATFNNNAYLFQLIDGKISTPPENRTSDILAVDPRTGESRVLYGRAPGQELWSVVRGHIQPVAGGGMMITETEGGRAFQIDAAGRTVWEYINRYDAENVIEMTSAEVYPASYFSVTDWTCP